MRTGTIVPTDAECKHGVDIAHNGQWGYHPLLVSCPTRPNRCSCSYRQPPSHEQADVYLDKSIDLSRSTGRLLARSSCGATPSSHRPGIRIRAGTRRETSDFTFGPEAHDSLSAGRRTSGRGPTASGTIAEVPDQDRAFGSSPERVKPETVKQRGHARRPTCSRRWSGEFDSSPDGLPVNLSDGRGAQAAGDRQGTGCGCSR